MQRKNLITAVVLLISLTFTAFQCSSTELTSAKLYIQQKNYDKALEALQNEVTKNPSSDEGYYLLGVVQGEKENYDEMVKAFDKSLSISDKFKSDIDNQKKYYWANLFNKGVAFYQRGNKSESEDSVKMFYDKSINAFENAVKIEPDSAATYKNLAFVYMSEGNNEKAIAPLEKIIEKENSLDGYKFLGQILYNKGTRLMNEYRSSNDPQDSVQALETFNKAITTLERGRKSYPNDADLLLYLSNSYIGANKIDVAKQAFKEGVEKEPENKYYRYNYGVLLLGDEDYPAAEEQFKKAIEIDPNYENAVYNLAVTYVKWGTKINDELKEDEDNAPVKEKYSQALPHLEKVVELKPDDAASWELLGKVYAYLNMTDDANNAFKKADEIRGKQ